jgi:hypothetical protein
LVDDSHMPALATKGKWASKPLCRIRGGTIAGEYLGVEANLLLQRQQSNAVEQAVDAGETIGVDGQAGSLVEPEEILRLVMISEARFSAFEKGTHSLQGEIAPRRFGVRDARAPERPKPFRRGPAGEFSRFKWMQPAQAVFLAGQEARSGK